MRITHLPTNTVVSMQDEKSQIKNREKAMRILRSRLLEIERQKQQDARFGRAPLQVGMAIARRRFAPIISKRTRVTDHRIGLTIHQLDQIMEGGIEKLLTRW